jgi:hypothetical protein
MRMAATADAGTAPDGDQPRTRWQKARGWLEKNAANIVLPALTVLVTAVAGTFAAIYAHGQIAAADEQKVVAQQQELLTLVVDIEQEPAAEQRATAPLKGTPLLDTQVQFQDELTSYAQAAQLIIGNLASQEVSGFEYVQVGKALAASGSNFQALKYFQRAAAAHGATPDTRAAALRNEAGVRYSLHVTGLAHQENIQAVQVFAHYPDLTRTDADNNMAQSYLDDASSEIAAGNCQLALADQQGAARVLGTLPDRNRTEATVNRVLTSDDAASYQKRCTG